MTGHIYSTLRVYHDIRNVHKTWQTAPATCRSDEPCISGHAFLVRYHPAPPSYRMMRGDAYVGACVHRRTPYRIVASVDVATHGVCRDMRTPPHLPRHSRPDAVPSCRACPAIRSAMTRRSPTSRTPPARTADYDTHQCVSMHSHHGRREGGKQPAAPIRCPACEDWLTQR